MLQTVSLHTVFIGTALIESVGRDIARARWRPCETGHSVFNKFRLSP